MLQHKSLETFVNVFQISFLHERTSSALIFLNYTSLCEVGDELGDIEMLYIQNIVRNFVPHIQWPYFYLFTPW